MRRLRCLLGHDRCLTGVSNDFGVTWWMWECNRCGRRWAT